MLRTVIAGFALILACTPVPAQSEAQPGDGTGLLEQGAKLFLKGLMAEMEPALRDLGAAFGDLGAYHPPELLPNGDILIRRREARPLPPVLPAERDQIDL